MSSDGAPNLSVFAEPDLLTALDGADDLDLLRFIADQAENPQRANAAWKAFYQRYKGWLWTKCVHVARDLGGDTWVQDIFYDVVEYVYLHAERFRLPPGAERASAAPRIKAWLGKITNTKLRKRLEGRYDEVTVDNEQWTKLDRAPEQRGEAGGKISTAERQGFRAAFNALSEREQVVLRVTFQYHRFDANFQRLPNKVVAELADQLGTTPENLRTIRTRAMRELRTALRPTSPANPRTDVNYEKK